MLRHYRIYNSLEELANRFFLKPGGSGFIYAFQVTNGVKIGCTYKPLDRLRTHEENMLIYSGRKLGKICLSIPVREYYKVEESIQMRLFDKIKYPGREVFSVSFNQAINIIDDVVSGFKKESAVNWHILAKEGNSNTLIKRSHNQESMRFIRNTLNQIYNKELLDA